MEVKMYRSRNIEVNLIICLFLSGISLLHRTVANTNVLVATWIYATCMSKILFILKLYLKGAKLNGMGEISIEMYTAEWNLFRLWHPSKRKHSLFMQNII